MNASALDSTRRAIEFARHMPISKLVRRIELGVRRQMRDRLRLPVAAATPLRRAEAPPLPILAPRKRLAARRETGGRAFTFLGRTVKMPGEAIDWRTPGAGAADQLWRMNLHYMEYLEGADDAELAALTSDWIGHNGVPGPGAWRDGWNSYALSIRLVVWLQQLALRRSRLPDAVVQRIEESAATQALFLEKNLETDLGGNHLVKNIKALILAGRYFAGPTAERWRQRGIALLARELDRQVLPDGVHDERSASYHAQVLADLIECRQALGDDPLSGRLDLALHRMAQAMADLAHPDGGTVLFNDSGLAMAYGPDECLRAYRRTFSTEPAPRAVFAFPDAGYFGLRSARQYVVFDCGRIAPDDLPAHGHADVLSFEWSVAGQRMVVDQGVFEYVAGRRRDQARAAASHNTLSLEGADQAEFFGAFRCGRRPNVEVRAWHPSPDGFVLEGAHDGYTTLPGQPRHVRRVEAGSADLSIEDRIEGTTDRVARIGFLLHPEVAVRREDETLVLERGPARARLRSSAPIAIEPAVWWPDMGLELATHRIVATPDRQALAPPRGVRTVLALEDR